MNFVMRFGRANRMSSIQQLTLQVPDTFPPDWVAVVFGDDDPESESGESSPPDGLRELLSQCRRACDMGLYYAAVMTALTVPSICGALGAAKGRCSGPEYRAWLVAAMGYDEDTAKRIYGLRCSLLHEGSSLPHREAIPIAFVEPLEPGFPDIHWVRTDVRNDIVEWLSIPLFIDELTVAVTQWLGLYGDTATVKRNFTKFAHRRPGGLWPHVVGTSVIA